MPTRQRHPRVLAVSFALRPSGGSEGGAAWGVVKSLMKVADVDVLVRPSDMPELRRWQQETGDHRVRFVEVKKSQASALMWRLSNIPKTEFLSYWIWLSAARRVGLELEKTTDYAAAVHVAYGSYWLPSPVVDFKAPSIWGPVGGATRSPRSMWRYLGWRGALGETIKYAMVRLVSRLPSVQRTWQQADFPLAETENTRQHFPKAVRARTRVINRAALQHVPERADLPRERYIVFPSRLQPRKGPALAIRALRHADPAVRLLFVADGMERRAMESLARRLGVADRVEFRGWAPREEMFEIMMQAAAAVFLGTREEGGCALAEAMQLGTPVIVLGVGGAKLLAETNTDASRVRVVEPASGGQTEREVGEAMTHFALNPHPSTTGFLDRDFMESQLLKVVGDAIDQHRERAAEPSAAADAPSADAPSRVVAPLPPTLAPSS